MRLSAAVVLSVVCFGACGPEGSGNDGGTGGGNVFGGGAGGGSGQQCSCRMTINGETKETSMCGGLLCFENVGEYYQCGPSGSTAVSSCGSTGGGSGSTGGGAGSTGGGSASTGGGSGSTGGGSASTGGGSGASGGGTGSNTCGGSFACGSITCDAATQYCRVGCDQLNSTTTYVCQNKTGTSCPSPTDFCISYIAITQCGSGRQATCSGDDATRGLEYGCRCQ